MGLFDSLIGNKSGHFIVHSKGNERISPEQYGHLLVRWSFESGFSLLNDIKNGDCNTSPFADVIRRNGKLQYLVVFQFSAIYASAYWYYASNFLKVGQDAQDRMKDGLDDGIQSTQIDGKPLDAFWVQLLRGALSSYLKANISDDVDSITGDGTFNPNVSAVAKTFFEIHEKYWPDIKPTEIDRLIIGHYVSDIPVSLYVALKNEIRLDFAHP